MGLEMWSDYAQYHIDRCHWVAIRHGYRAGNNKHQPIRNDCNTYVITVQPLMAISLKSKERTLPPLHVRYLSFADSFYTIPAPVIKFSQYASVCCRQEHRLREALWPANAFMSHGYCRLLERYEKNTRLQFADKRDSTSYLRALVAARV